jgi:hypothetical protein
MSVLRHVTACTHLGLLLSHVLLVCLSLSLSLRVSLGLGLLSLYLGFRHVHVRRRNAARDGNSDRPLLTGGLLWQLRMGRFLGGVDAAVKLAGARRQEQLENSRILFRDTVLRGVGFRRVQAGLRHVNR